MSLANLPLRKRFRLGTSLRVLSALPYNITTGRDDNGDTSSNDRPAGVTRNTGRGSTLVDMGARLSWSIGFGVRYQGMPQVNEHGVHIGATSMMVILVVLLAGMMIGLGVAFVGLAYHHEKRVREFGHVPGTRTVS